MNSPSFVHTTHWGKKTLQHSIWYLLAFELFSNKNISWNSNADQPGTS